jgi:hypothetical protein
MKRNFFGYGIHAGKPIFMALRCCHAEGSNNPRSSATDQRQTQLTTGTTGANSPNATATDGGYLNTGVNVQGNVTATDLGAVDKAFQFGDTIAASLGKVYAQSSDAATTTQKANTDFLSGVLGSFTAQTDAGQAATSQKTLLYLGGAALALVAVIFLFRKA